ncbi:conserved Plasmodium protein, unknown function [Plasmodium berghei]|nr:conserved Plasmodium protein, unknown function [Plasmodium berghei]SCM17051.1 conserved Plasmodium protein, unknown function [Plasmodium berghei]
MYVNKVLEININDIIHDINVFYKNNKINDSSGQLEIINTKNYFCKKSISKYDGTFVIHLEKVILICIQQLEKWNFFKYENPLIGTNKIDKCVCVPNLNLIILQKSNQIFVEEFQTVFINNKINELKLQRRNSISVPSIFFFVFENRLYILDKNSQLWQVNVKDCLNPSRQMEIVKTFELPKNINEIYFKIEKKKNFIISYVNEKEKCIYIIIYNIKTNISQKNKLFIPDYINFEKGIKNITSVSLNQNYFIIFFNSNELFIYRRNEKQQNNMNNIHTEITKSQNNDSYITCNFHKFLGEKQCSQIKYFNNKSLQEIEKYTLEYINKKSKISSISINDDNSLFLIYSANFLEKNTQNKLNNNKYTSIFQKFTDEIYQYYQKFENYSFSKMYGSDNINSSNLLYDISHNLYKRNNMHATLVNIDNNPKNNLNTLLYKNYISTKINPFGNDITSDNTHFNYVTHLYRDTIKKLTKNFNNINEQKELNDNEKIKELLKYSRYLNIHEINQNKIKAINKEFYDDNKIEKEFLYMGFLKDLTNNKKYNFPLESYNNIYLCKTDQYYLILQNSEQNFNLILYKFKFLNKQELLLHLFFYSYYDAVLKSELFLFNILHQFFIYSIYDYSGRYLDSSFLDYQCLFKIRNVFDFLGRAVIYDPFLVRNSSEKIDKLLSLKDNAYNSGPSILTNMNHGEENNNYDYFFYTFSKEDQINYSSKYINKYHIIEKIKLTQSDIHIDIDIQLNKLKNVLFSALRLIYYILKENENYDDISDCSDKNELDEHLFINTIIQTNLKISKPYKNQNDGEDSDQSSELSQVINSDRSSSWSDNDKQEKEENKKKEYLFDLDYKAFESTIEIIKTNEDMKNVLLKYKIELLRQIYKYKVFKYIIKLLKRERYHKSCYYINKEHIKNGKLAKCASTIINNNKNNFPDLLSMFKTNDKGNEQNVREESVSNYSHSFSEHECNYKNGNFHDVINSDKKNTNIYLINWTKFKYDYTPFDIVKYFLINKNYILTKIFYKYFKSYIDNNWQHIFYYIPLNTKIEDFFFLLPRIKKVNILSNKSNTFENVLPQINTSQKHLNKNPEPYNEENHENSKMSYNEEILKSQNSKKDKHNATFKYKPLPFEEKEYDINVEPKNMYEIYCSENEFFEFFIIRCIKIITETHLIRSRLLMFVYISIKIINQNNIYKIFNYDKKIKKYTYNSNYFDRYINKSNNKQNEKNTLSTSLHDGKEDIIGNDITISNPINNISNNCINTQPCNSYNTSMSLQNDNINNNEKFVLQNKQCWNDSNLCDGNFIKNKLQIYLKKDNIKNKNVILIYSLFILIKMYLQSKENHKNIKFEEFMLMDIYKKLCLTIDFDKKYISYEYDQENGNISLFYNKIIDVLSNYKYINAYIMESKNSYYSIFEANIIELYFKNPTNILESIYFNILYTSEQLYVIFCLTTLKQLQLKYFTRYIVHIDNKNRIFPQIPLKKFENISRNNLNYNKQKNKKNAKIDEIYIFLKYIYYAYKHKIMLNDNYQFCYLFLIIFYKYIKINLIHFISIFNDFYNIFPKNVTIKSQPYSSNTHLDKSYNNKTESNFYNFKENIYITSSPFESNQIEHTTTSTHFNINSIFKQNENNQKNVIIHNEHLEYIINCYHDQIEKEYKNDENKEKDNRHVPNCELVEKYLDIFEKHLNALETIKFLNKEINNEENKLNININIIINSKNNMKKSILNIFKIFKYIILYTNYKDDNFTKNCLQVYYNLFNSLHIHIFFFILFYIILFYSNDFRYLYSFIKYYEENYPNLKNVFNYSNIISYLILSKAKTITIYDNFYDFYNFLKKVTSHTDMFNHIDKIKEIVLCLKTMLYIQKLLNQTNKHKENYTNFSKYINKTNAQTKYNENIYHSFSKLIVDPYEISDIPKNFNSLNNIENVKIDYKNININNTAKYIIYDNYISIQTEGNKFKIFKNVIEYNLDISYNYKKVIKLIKFLQIKKSEQLLDSILFVVSIIISQIEYENNEIPKKKFKTDFKTNNIKNESIVTFYLILFMIFSKNHKLKKYKTFIQNVIKYYTILIPNHPQYLYNLSLFFSSYLCLDYTFFLNNIYKYILKKNKFAAILNHTNITINDSNTTFCNFTTIHDLFQETSFKKNKNFSFSPQNYKSPDTPIYITSNFSEKIKSDQSNFADNEIGEKDEMQISENEKTEEINISFFESTFLDNIINEGVYKHDDISSDFEKTEKKKTQSVSSLFLRNEIDTKKKTIFNSEYMNNSDMEEDDQDITSTDDTSQENESDKIKCKQDSDNENSLNHLKINCYKKTINMHNFEKNYVDTQNDQTINKFKTEQIDYLSKSEVNYSVENKTYKNLFINNIFVNHIKKAYSKISKSNISKWKTNYIIQTVNNIKHILKNTKVESMNKNYDETFAEEFHFYIDKDKKQNYKINQKSYFYKSLFHNNLDVAFLYLLQAQDHIFIYNFFKHILQNNNILIVKKISIIDAFIRSVYRIGKSNEINVFLKKLLISISIIRYLLFHLYINKINKIDIKKLYFEDTFKKNIVKSLYKNKSEHILEVIIKIVDMFKVNLEHIKYKFFIQNKYIICKIYNEVSSLLNNQLTSYSQKNKINHKDTNNSYIYKNFHIITNKFQYIFEIEVEKEIMHEIQKQTSNNFLLLYILKNFQRLSYNVDFIFKILFYIYQICLYYICPAIYFIILSSFHISFDKSLSYIHQHLSNFPKNKLISVMVNIRTVFFYFKNNLNHNIVLNNSLTQIDSDQNKQNIFSIIYPEMTSKIEPTTQDQFNNNMNLLCLWNLLSNFDSEINKTDLNSPSQCFTFSLKQTKLKKNSKNNFDISKLKCIKNKTSQNYFNFLLNKTNISPYLYDLNFLLEYLRIYFYPYIFLNLPDYDKIKNIIDIYEKGYLKYYIFQLTLEENELNPKLCKQYNIYSMLTTNDIYKYFYSNKKYIKIFIDFFIYYNIIFKFNQTHNEKCQQFFENILFQDFEFVRNRIKLRYSKWMFLKKYKLNKFFIFYNFLYNYNIYNQNSFYKLIVDNIFEIDILLLILFCIKNNVKIVKYILFKIIIIIFFKNIKINELSLQNIISFISLNAEYHQQNCNHNFDKFPNLFSVILSNEKGKDAENKYYETNLIQNFHSKLFNKDIYIDQTMCNISDTKNEKCNLKNNSSNELIDIDFDENDRYFSGNMISDILNKMEQKLITNMSKVTEENNLFYANSSEIKPQFNQEQINSFMEKNKNSQIEDTRINTKIVTNFCLKYINIKYIIKKWIKNELKSILFISLHQESNVKNLLEKSKNLYFALSKMNGKNVFYYLKEMIRLILQTNRNNSTKQIYQGRIYQFYHFFIIIQAINYLKIHVEIKNNNKNEKTSYIIKNDEKSNNDTQKKYANQIESEINNLDNNIDDKTMIIKSLFFILLIKIVNIYLPTLNKLFFIREENYLYYDKKKNIILKYDIKNFIFILFNFIQTTYSKGYEFIYISLLFLIEYCISLMTKNEEIEKNPTFSYIFIYKKVQNIVNKYTQNYILKNTHQYDDTFKDPLDFIDNKIYLKIKNELSKIYLKILSNCEKYMLLICKIIIGNRINIHDENILLKNSNIDLLYFFTCNYCHIKKNKQNILSPKDNIKKQKIKFFQNQSENRSTSQNTNQIDIFNKNIYKFIKILLVIINYNIIPFKNWEYYDTIKQIIADKEWYKIFELQTNNKKYSSISFLCLKNYKSNHPQLYLEEFNSLSSYETTSNNFDKTLEFFFQPKNILFNNLKNDNLKYDDSDSNFLSNEYKKETLSITSNLQYNINNVESKPTHKQSTNQLPQQNKDDESEFEFNDSLTTDAILNKYGKGFLLSYLNTLNTNEKSQKHFKNIYKKSKMINLLKYSLHILDYWSIDIADSDSQYDEKNKKEKREQKQKENHKKGNKINNHINQSNLFRKNTELKAEGKEESLQLLIFFANYFHFFQNYLQYKILLKMHINNNLSEVNELFFNKGRMWSWYFNETKIKNMIKDCLIKNIYYTDLFNSKTNDEFLKLINKMSSKYTYISKQSFQISEKESLLKDNNNLLDQTYDCFYLKNYHFNKFNKHFIRSLQIQYYLFAKYTGANINMPQNNQNFSKIKNDFNAKHNDFPMFLLNILDICKNTTDVYDFYYQLIIHKLKDDDKLNLKKIQNYWNNLQIYFKNKINNYDLYLMLFYYQYFTFQSIQNSNPSISYLPKNEQKFILYMWIHSTQDLEKKYR